MEKHQFGEYCQVTEYCNSQEFHNCPFLPAALENKHNDDDINNNCVLNNTFKIIDFCFMQYLCYDHELCVLKQTYVLFCSDNEHDEHDEHDNVQEYK